jgi:hypothetical protein
MRQTRKRERKGSKYPEKNNPLLFYVHLDMLFLHFKEGNL